MGLGKVLLNTVDFDNILEMAEKGNLSVVDLQLEDISKSAIGTLRKGITVSNFGKISDRACREDIAAGILNMVFQTIGMFSVFAAKIHKDENIIFTGKLADIAYGQDILNSLISEGFFDGNFIFPQFAEYATAIGAAISLMKYKF